MITGNFAAARSDTACRPRHRSHRIREACYLPRGNCRQHRRPQQNRLFLIRHEQDFAGNPRTALMVKHVGKMSVEDKTQIGLQAEAVRTGLDGV